MKVVIKTTNLKLDKELSQYIEEKLNSLEKFSEIFQTKKYFNNFYKKAAKGEPRSPRFAGEAGQGRGKPKVEAWVEIGKTSKHHQKGKVFWAECQMRFPKRSLRSVAKSENLKQAITGVKDELQRELEQYKEKFRAKTKRGARILKKELKLSPLARFYRKGRIREEGI